MFFGDLVGVLDQVRCFDFLDEVLDLMLFEVFFEEDDAFAAYPIPIPRLVAGGDVVEDALLFEQDGGIGVVGDVVQV